MANPRQPVARAAITGAAAKNPQRHKGRSNPKTGALGGAPTHLSLEGKRAWARFRIELPWLTASDAAILEIASRIRADLLTGEDVGVARLNLYSTVLGKLGATPADRSKVIVPDDDNDEEDEFFGRC